MMTLPLTADTTQLNIMLPSTNQGLMQGSDTSTCNQYDQVCAGDDIYQGDGYDDFMAFTNGAYYGYLTPEEIREIQKAEQLQCSVHRDCIISWDDNDYDERCLTVTYPLIQYNYNWLILLRSKYHTLNARLKGRTAPTHWNTIQPRG